MSIDVTVKIGGEAGQGIQTVGTLLARTCRRAGLYVMAVNDFESRIRGGHNFFQIRIRDQVVRAADDRVHLLVGLDAATYDLHHDQLVPGGLAVMDDAENASGEGVLPVPITALAQEAGGKILANTVAAGACLALLSAPLTLFLEILSEQFKEKAAAVIQDNQKAAALGYQAVEKTAFSHAFPWKEETPKGVLLSGDQAIALGAAAADCRFSAFYPMSPSTGIHLHLTALADRLPLVVEQAEDEIAAVNMAVGASFAGVRAMTATSGGGFCLMTEGLGLAGMSETPLVVIDAQRPGPATGMATRTAQADLLFLIHASQDEFPRFVFAPKTLEDGFAVTAHAFELSEKYQVPALILVDQYFIDSLVLVDTPLEIPKNRERFILEPAPEEAAAYRRYAVTADGISPRALPGRSPALVVFDGNEHREDGHTTEDATNRTRMVDKRNAKIPSMQKEMRPPETFHPEARTILAGWGSTYGVIRETVERLRGKKIDIGHVHFTDLWPFPVDSGKAALEKARRRITVENNSTGQLARLLCQETGIAPEKKILKYDGRPFYVGELEKRVGKLLEEGS